jgi:hypothetical protein
MAGSEPLGRLPSRSDDEPRRGENPHSTINGPFRRRQGCPGRGSRLRSRLLDSQRRSHRREKACQDRREAQPSAINNAISFGSVGDRLWTRFILGGTSRRIVRRARHRQGHGPFPRSGWRWARSRWRPRLVGDSGRNDSSDRHYTVIEAGISFSKQATNFCPNFCPPEVI